MPNTIRLHDLTLGYERHPAVHHLTGEVPPGSLLAIVGPNGAGKSTLLKGMVGILKPLSGHVECAAALRGGIAYLPQAADIDRSFPISTYEFIAMGGWRQFGIWRRMTRDIRDKIAEAIAAVGLAGSEKKPIGALSGGQMQRALFARLLLQDAPIILLDEPFTAIDQKTTADLVTLIQGWHSDGRTVIAVLHDLTMVQEVFPQTLLLAREKVAWCKTGDALNPENLLIARRLVEKVDHSAHPCERGAI